MFSILVAAYTMDGVHRVCMYVLGINSNSNFYFRMCVCDVQAHVCTDAQRPEEDVECPPVSVSALVS